MASRSSSPVAAPAETTPRSALAAPAPRPLSLVPLTSDVLVLYVSLVGVTLRCVVNPQWPCETLFVAAASAYFAAFPDTEVPDCNVMFHRQKQVYLEATTLLCDSCGAGDEVELSTTRSVEPRDHSSMETAIAWSEFCVVFHKLPLGFTMKRGVENTTQVGTIYPKSAATHFPRLVPGVTIISIAGTRLEAMGLRQVHTVVTKAELPLRMCFQGPAVGSSSMPQPLKPIDATGVLTNQLVERHCQGLRERGSTESGSRDSRGRKERDERAEENQEHTQDDGVREVRENEQDAASRNETALIRQIEQLKVQLLCKHDEAKQIARQLETCSEQLLALRGHLQATITPRSRRTAPLSCNHPVSKLRLTSKVLAAMDQKAGLPRRVPGSDACSNVSSVSGSSAHSMPVVRSTSAHTRSVRAVTLATADNVSVSSYQSNSSNTSARRNHSSRGTAFENLNKRYNYMPQKYATSTSGVAESGSSSRGAVMSRARNSRNPFVTRSESPGVGYYDVQVKDRVKGGEIGDSDRSLAWS